LKRLKVYRTTVDPEYLFDFDFHPKKVQYLFEPLFSKIEPRPTYLPTFGSFSPDPIRYKEFTKNGGANCYMPVYTLPELLAIGRYIRSKANQYMELFSDDNIRDRYEKFGGIIRRVLPENEIHLKVLTSGYNDAVHKLSIEQIRQVLNQGELSSAESFLVQWTPTIQDNGKVDYFHCTRFIVNDSIKYKLKQQLGD